MDESFTQGLVAGFILCFALMFFIGSVLERREKRYKDKSWCERRSRHVYRELPGPDMTEDEARCFSNHMRFTDLPGQRNGALVGYLAGKHDVVMMERKLDARFGFGDCAYDGYVRGKTIAEHEEQMRKQAELRRQEQS